MPKAAVNVDIKEKHAISKFSVVESNIIIMLREPTTGAIMVRSKAEAELASDIVNTRIPACEKLIEELWGDDCKKAYDLWKSIVAKRDRFLKPLKTYGQQIRQAVALFQINERRKAELEAQEKQRILDEAIPDSGVVFQPEKPSVDGFSAPISRKSYKVVDLMGLIKLVVKGKMPVVCLQVNPDYWTQDEIKKQWAMSKPDETGKRLICDGAIELTEEFTSSRR